MVNPFQDIDWQPDAAARRRFGRSLAIGFPVVAVTLAVGARWATGRWPEWPWWLGAGGVGAGVFCWLVPSAALPLYLGWHVLGAAVGVVVSNVLLAATYVTTVVPIGLIMRACGRDPMRRRFDAAASSYWRPLEPAPEPERYFRQF